MSTCSAHWLSPSHTFPKRTPEYLAWVAMRQRTKNPKAHNWQWYGGRGIEFDPAWNCFHCFLADVGPRPDGHWIERIDNSKGYGPGNCRWATPSEQGANRRGRRPDPKSLKSRSRAVGLPYMVVYLRIRSGWDEARALSTPVQKRKPRCDYHP